MDVSTYFSRKPKIFFHPLEAPLFPCFFALLPRFLTAFAALALSACLWLFGYGCPIFFPVKSFFL
jgi:hypothetical protein